MMIWPQHGDDNAQQNISRDGEESPAGNDAFETNNVHNFKDFIT
jgi:hypothetical protein